MGDVRKRIDRAGNPDEGSSMTLPFKSDEVARRLLDWYGREGRDLPWRATRDPYRIWLSEIMLQQTTVAAVIPYYARFLERFPDIQSLASSSLDEVIALWAGLGYYSRARNLHRTARLIVENMTGSFPDNLTALMSLPGIGRSTAGAILSIAFNKPAAILDGNVRRVLVRLFCWREDPRCSDAERKLWQWAEALTPANNPHDYAQSIMDLGATVCTPREPSCCRCPLEEICLARREGLATELPATPKKQKLPTRVQTVLIVLKQGSCLLRQRPTEGFLGGLWEFPAIDLADGQDPCQAVERLLGDLGFCGSPVKFGDIRHAYSHFKLDLKVFSVDDVATRMVAERDDYRWFRPEELAELPLHGAHRKIFQSFLR
jgi:A/G-specific adenine glycosylase